MYNQTIYNLQFSCAITRMANCTLYIVNRKQIYGFTERGKKQNKLRQEYTPDNIGDEDGGICQTAQGAGAD